LLVDVLLISQIAECLLRECINAGEGFYMG
jgi:hypothetical protein